MSKYEIVVTVISLLALLVSLYTLHLNRKTISVIWDENIFIFDSSCLQGNNNDPLLASCRCARIKLGIINTSPHDIGYFDLIAFAPNKKLPYELLTKESFSKETKPLKPLFVLTDFSFPLDLPDRNFGILKASSLTKIDIILLENPFSFFDLEDNVKMSFKVANAKNPFSLRALSNNLKLDDYKTYFRNYEFKKAVDPHHHFQA